MEKIQREVSILEKIKGLPYVVQIRELVIEEGTNSPVLVTEYIENKKGHL